MRILEGKVYQVELHSLYSLQAIFRVIWYRRMRWKEHAVCMGNIKWPLIEKHDETGPFVGNKYNIKMELKVQVVRLWYRAVWLRAQPSG